MTRPGFIGLRDLLARGRERGAPVAAGPEGARSWDDLVRAASGYRAAFSARPEAAFALHREDSWDFACALLGAWAAGKRVAVPGDALPATLARLDLPAAPEPLDAPAAHQGRIPDLGARALTVYTSGSAGTPVGFDKSLDQLEAEIAALEGAFGKTLGGAAILCTVSHQHLYGLLFKILWPLCGGRVIHLAALFYPEEILAAARGYPAAALVTSPAHLGRMPEGLDWAGAADRWRAVFSSGGPLPIEAARRTARLLGRAPREVYGSSETGGVAWRERGGEGRPWTTFPGVEVALDAGTGALRVRSPHLPDRDWFTTADRARLAPDGFELLGRMDRIVKVGEKRISLAAVEEALLGSGLAAAARVVPLAAEEGRLGAVVVPSGEGARLAAKDLPRRLRAALAGKVDPLAVPRHWRFAAALPANPQGKVTQEALLGMFEARPGRRPSPGSGAPVGLRSEAGGRGRGEPRCGSPLGVRAGRRGEPGRGVSAAARKPRPRFPERLSLSREGPDRAVLALRIPEDLLYFEGHFPGAPILPGIVQLDWAIRLAREILGLAGEFASIESLKFQRVLRPADEVELRIEWDPAKGRLRFEYHGARGRHSAGSVVFRQSA